MVWLLLMNQILQMRGMEIRDELRPSYGVKYDHIGKIVQGLNRYNLIVGVELPERWKDLKQVGTQLPKAFGDWCGKIENDTLARQVCFQLIPLIQEYKLQERIYQEKISQRLEYDLVAILPDADDRNHLDKAIKTHPDKNEYHFQVNEQDPYNWQYESDMQMPTDGNNRAYHKDLLHRTNARIDETHRRINNTQKKLDKTAVDVHNLENFFVNMEEEYRADQERERQRMLAERRAREEYERSERITDSILRNQSFGRKKRNLSEDEIGIESTTTTQISTTTPRIEIRNETLKAKFKEVTMSIMDEDNMTHSPDEDLVRPSAIPVQYVDRRPLQVRAQETREYLVNIFIQWKNNKWILYPNSTHMFPDIKFRRNIEKKLKGAETIECARNLEWFRLYTVTLIDRWKKTGEVDYLDVDNLEEEMRKVNKTCEIHIDREVKIVFLKILDLYTNEIDKDPETRRIIHSVAEHKQERLGFSVRAILRELEVEENRRNLTVEELMDRFNLTMEDLNHSRILVEGIKEKLMEKFVLWQLYNWIADANKLDFFPRKYYIDRINTTLRGAQNRKCAKLVDYFRVNIIAILRVWEEMLPVTRTRIDLMNSMTNHIKIECKEEIAHQVLIVREYMMYFHSQLSFQVGRRVNFIRHRRSATSIQKDNNRDKREITIRNDEAREFINRYRIALAAKEYLRGKYQEWQRRKIIAFVISPRLQPFVFYLREIRDKVQGAETVPCAIRMDKFKIVGWNLVRKLMRRRLAIIDELTDYRQEIAQISEVCNPRIFGLALKVYEYVIDRCKEVDIQLFPEERGRPRDNPFRQERRQKRGVVALAATAAKTGIQKGIGYGAKLIMSKITTENIAGLVIDGIGSFVNWNKDKAIKDGIALISQRQEELKGKVVKMNNNLLSVARTTSTAIVDVWENLVKQNAVISAITERMKIAQRVFLSEAQVLSDHDHALRILAWCFGTLETLLRHNLDNYEHLYDKAEILFNALDGLSSGRLNHHVISASQLTSYLKHIEEVILKRTSRL